MRSRPASRLTKEDIRRLFELLDAELAALGVDGELYLVGGAVMCLALDARKATRDVAAFSRPTEVIREAARAGVPDTWLNYAVKGFLSPRGSFDFYLELAHLKVFMAHPAFVLAMKCAALRLGEEFHDLDDVRFLLRYLDITTAEQAELLLACGLASSFTVLDDELAEALLAILENGEKPEAVRGQAAISLGPALEIADTQGFEDPDGVPITERTFRRFQESLRTLYLDAQVPRDVRRRILEASVRASQDWHEEAVRAAYASDDATWQLTAVFCMQFVPGFEAEILEALGSESPDIHYEAVLAAGSWEVDAAWPHVAALLTSNETEKPLLLAAIEAAAGIRPHEAMEILQDLADSDGEDIVEAVDEAMAMAGKLWDGKDDEEERC